MTDTVLHRIPVTGVMDLLFTTNGCIDILGGVDIQFMLTVRSGAGETVDSPISIDAAKQIFLANCGSEDEWLESFGDAVEFARKLREEDQADQAWRSKHPNL
jgi:hypothetical protein